MVQYVAKQGSQLKGDIQAEGTFLEALREKDGLIDRYSVTDAARDSSSPIHCEFEWDDEVAAEEWRFEQAAYLIRSICVVREAMPDREPQIVRAFVSVSGETNRHAFTSIVVALSDPDLRRQVLERALRELEAWQHKYEQLEELAELFSVVRGVQSKIKEAA